MKWFVYISFVLLISLNIYDAYSTHYLLNIGFHEANPILAWLMSIIGIVPTLLIMKVSFLFMILSIYVRYFKKAKQNLITTRYTCFILSCVIIPNAIYSWVMYTLNYQLMKII